MVRYRSW